MDNKIKYWQVTNPTGAIVVFRGRNRFKAISSALDPAFKMSNETMGKLTQLDKETAGWVEIKADGWEVYPVT